jgi:GT2 family glycosyltransferase
MVPEIVIQLVLYNDALFLPGLLSSLRKQTFNNFHLIAVDNSSDDSVAKKFRELWPEGELYRSDCNLGYAGGHNRLMETTLKRGAPFALVLNTDVLLQKDFLRNLHDQLVRFPGVDACGPLILQGINNRKTKIVQNYRLYMDFPLGRKSSPDEGRNLRSYKELPVSADVDYLSGVAFMIRTSVFKNISFFDPGLFLYGEERDFFYRFSKSGRVAMVTRKAVCWHLHDWAAQSKEGYRREYYYLRRNKILYFKKYNFRRGLIRFLLFELIKLPLTLVWSSGKGGIKMFGWYWLGIWHGLTGRKGRYI